MVKKKIYWKQCLSCRNCTRCLISELLTKENLTSTQLAKRLKMSQPPVWRMLNSMIKEGRVIRENRIGKRNIPYSLAKWRN